MPDLRGLGKCLIPDFLRFGESLMPDLQGIGKTLMPDSLRFGKSMAADYLRLGKSLMPDFVRLGKSLMPDLCVAAGHVPGRAVQLGLQPRLVLLPPQPGQSRRPKRSSQRRRRWWWGRRWRRAAHLWQQCDHHQWGAGRRWMGPRDGKRHWCEFFLSLEIAPLLRQQKEQNSSMGRYLPYLPVVILSQFNFNYGCLRDKNVNLTYHRYLHNASRWCFLMITFE